MTGHLADNLLAALGRRANMMPVVRLLCGQMPARNTPAWPGLPFSVTYLATATTPSSSGAADQHPVAPFVAQETAAVSSGLWAIILSLLLLGLLFGLIAHSQHLLVAKRDSILESLAAAREALAASERAVRADRASRAALAEERAELYAAALRRIGELEKQVSGLQNPTPPPKPGYADAATNTPIPAPPPAPKVAATNTEALKPTAAESETLAKKLEDAVEAQKDAAAVQLAQVYRDTTQALKARSGVRARAKLDMRYRAGIRAGLFAAGLPTDGVAFQKAEEASVAPRPNPPPLGVHLDKEGVSTELASSFREWVYYWALDNLTASPPVHANFPSEKLTIGAGVAIFHFASERVVLCYHSRDKYWFLPKGRRNANEATTRAAEREGFEESGYKNRLLPLPMKHRQTKDPEKGDEHFVTEPLWTQLLPLTATSQYMLFWYAAETVPRDVEDESARVYRAPDPFPAGMTIRQRIAMDKMTGDDGKQSVYEPVRHEGTGVEEEELMYKSYLLPIAEARRKLKGSVMEDVIWRAWEGVRLRMELEGG
ncbi:hypothetical protein B0A55_10241 [Friedmanniomyces simplex]|uniref:Nudix hydrolase domain-containing protein n=1 Tax=Friedmanniomyces simplex TaxID=329884 RepID=A0A4U0WVJ4_9PEZI|nr:hypothetical protein B0A55_10241 [Friedmanniomyces simplex]